jgi:hypothetical protein
MSSGTSLNKLRGRIILGEPNIISNWKGRLVVRAMAKRKAERPQLSYATQKQNVAMFSPMWRHTLTQAQRDEWEQYASQLNAINQDKADISGGEENIIPQTGKIRSGFNAYIGSWMLLRWSYDPTSPPPVLLAPISDPKVSPITDLAIQWQGPPNNRVHLTWTNPTWTGTILYVIVRIWVASSHFPTQRRGLSVITTSPGAPAFYNFDTVRIGGKSTSGYVHIAKFSKTLFKAQVDVLSQTALNKGCLTSAPSNIAKAIIPP